MQTTCPYILKNCGDLRSITRLGQETFANGCVFVTLSESEGSYDYHY